MASTGSNRERPHEAAWVRINDALTEPYPPALMAAFIRMGGTADRVALLPLKAQGEAMESASGTSVFHGLNAATPELQQVAQSFRQFDVSQTKCCKAEDKHFLLGVIEVAFGELSTFNSIVQSMFLTDILEQRHVKDQTHRSALTRMCNPTSTHVQSKSGWKSEKSTRRETRGDSTRRRSSNGFWRPRDGESGRRPSWWPTRRHSIEERRSTAKVTPSAWS